MPLKYEKSISRQMLRDNPKDLFVFGDNWLERGYGGQAAAMRGEPNAIGIPTKIAPHNGEGAFFKDEHLRAVKPIIEAKFAKLARHLKQGGTVVWPADDIGTGRAKLKEKAPAIWGLIQELKTQLQ